MQRSPDKILSGSHIKGQVQHLQRTVVDGFAEPPGLVVDYKSVTVHLYEMLQDLN